MRAFGRFLYGLIIGDDWTIAALVVLVLAVAAFALLAGVSDTVAAVGAAVLIGAGFAVIVRRAARRG